MLLLGLYGDPKLSNKQYDMTSFAIRVVVINGFYILTLDHKVVCLEPSDRQSEVFGAAEQLARLLGTFSYQILTLVDLERAEELDLTQLDELVKKRSATSERRVVRATAPPHKAAIHLEDGLVMRVVSDVPLDFVVYDHDVQGCDADSIESRPSLDERDSVTVYDSSTEHAEVDAQRIQQVFEFMQQKSLSTPAFS